MVLLVDIENDANGGVNFDGQRESNDVADINYNDTVMIMMIIVMIIMVSAVLWY